MDNKLVKRSIFPRIKEHLKREEITLIIGPRQVGKTTLVLQLRDYLLYREKIPPSRVHYFNLDVVSDQLIFGSQTDFIQFLKNRLSDSDRLYVFIDEVQRITNPGLFFKGVYDLRLPVKLILTGSSSLEIRAKMSEPLTGRKQLFKLPPLTFREYISFHEDTLLSFFDRRDRLAESKLLNYLHQFIIFGGYPKIAVEKDQDRKISLIEEIFTSYVEKDVIGFLKIQSAIYVMWKG